MAVLEGGVSTSLAGVGAEAASGLHVSLKPLAHGALGHYSTTHRFVLVATQAANSRLFELRNTHATQLLVLTRLVIKWLTVAAHTAFIEDSLDAYKVSGFSAVDTVGTVTPTTSVKRTAGMAVVGSSIAAVRGVTVAGAAGGMTGGTVTKDGSPFSQHPMVLPQAAEAVTETTPRTPNVDDCFDDSFAGHPFVFAQNEGFLIENRVVLGAAAGSSVYVKASWAEVVAY